MYYTPQIPYLISKVLKGDYSDVIGNVKESFAIGRVFAFGLGYTIMSSETEEYRPGDIDIDPDYRIMNEGSNLSGLGGEFINEVRNLWEIEQIKEERRVFKEKSNVPVLVLNGLYDHVIPPKYDAEMKEYLENCYMFRFDGVTHSVADNAPECGIPMILEFLENPSAAPDSSCIQGRSMKFITGGAGK
jgi:pimeloyl-ACP methyl ester carboxylesterase